VRWRAPECSSAKFAALLRTLRDARAAGEQCAVLAHDAAVLRAVESCLVAWRWPHCRARDALLADGAAHVVRLQHLGGELSGASRTRCSVAVSVLLCTVIFYANHAHNLTRSPSHL
jgi:hypothetical protein